ncbi:alpha/beta-type small acid-soluble spore protein [Dehalobacter sp. DCM]|uniref:alpha/beta-type small acid-soluble spore protein n=1 Tax=Dehalobacter sp. DCM TaxID=2907827 RepID=UPI0030817A3D|nr:alpha/beta-type small acid-soluble spore protein [Dehalobacter sp. DCM]
MGKRNNSNPALDQLKYEVSKELGYINSGAHDYEQFLDETKYEVANELGIQLNHGYNGDITSRDAGRIGGHIGGKIGGNMVRKMIEFAENSMVENGGKL